MAKENYKAAVYSVEIEIAKSLQVVFDQVIDVSKWWPEDFEGQPLQLNHEFVFKSGDTHFSKNKVVEFEPPKKVVWFTTESIRKSDNYDWTGTKFIFELTSKGDNTLVKFTYNGVVLAHEYDRLIQICDITIKEMLYNFLLTAK